MIWNSEEHRLIDIADSGRVHVELRAEFHSKETVELVDELLAGIDILLKDYERRATELRDKRSTEQQLRLYRVLEGKWPMKDKPITASNLNDKIVGVDHGSSDGDHSAYTVLDCAETEDSDDPESEKS